MQGSCGRIPKWGNLHRCYKWRHMFWPRAATWYLNWFFFPFPPIYLFILDASIVQERGWCVTLIFNTAEIWGTQLETGTHLNPEHPVSATPKTANSPNREFQLKLSFCWPPASFLCRDWAQGSQNRPRKAEAFGSCLGRTRLFNCVKHSCMSERTLGLAFTRNLFRTILSGLTRNKICTWVSSPHVTPSRNLHWARKLNFWLER